MRIIFWLFYTCLCVGAGWIIGSKHKAPPIVLEITDRLTIATKDVIIKALERRTETPIVDIVDVTKPNDNGTEATPLLKTPIAPGEIAPAPITKTEEILPLNGTAPFVLLCKISNIANAPKTNTHGHVSIYKALTDVEGVTMAMMPVEDACISSGFGRRKGKLHKGIDYYNGKGGTIFAAGDGQILEAEYRNDYGYTVLINHGNGYFTRYAHLAGFTDGVIIGTAVPRGFALGEMGKTAGYNIPKHLHFELLQGDYNTPKKSFGLKPVNILDFN